MAEHCVDKIYIRNLALRCIIGIYPEERENKQDVIVNIVMGVDLAKPGLSDDIEDTVNYKSIKKEVLALVEASDYFLVEKMAQEIATLCLANTRVAHVTVTVDKPGALRFAESVAVEIYREQSA